MSALAAKPPTWREVLHGERGRLIVGLLVLETMFALHFLTITTVMPAVLDDLGSIALYGWSFTAASLAQLAVIPVAGAAVDRFGPRVLTILVAIAYTAGLIVAATAPSMGVVVAGRFLQGTASGGAYALSLGVVAKALPERHRARVLALLATTWLLPGLFGPPLGAVLAETVGWRFAFLVPFPVLVACLFMILPSLRAITGTGAGTIPLGRPFVLMLGAGAFFGALTALSLLTLPVLIVGAIVALAALKGLVPAGTHRARTGPAAAAVGAFLLSVAFVATESFAPLMFTDVRMRALTEVAVVLAVTPFAWAGGSWWQSREVERRSLAWLTAVAAAIVAVGLSLTAAGLMLGVPLAIAYTGWVVIALGMGIGFPTMPLAAMSAAGAGTEASDLSPTLLMDMLGIAVGAGLGGASLAIADRAGGGLTPGLAGAFAVSAVAVTLLFFVAPRIATPAR
ncbi:MAG: MFS transporter [Actinomycetota bacterium]